MSIIFVNKDYFFFNPLFLLHCDIKILFYPSFFFLYFSSYNSFLLHLHCVLAVKILICLVFVFILCLLFIFPMYENEITSFD